MYADILPPEVQEDLNNGAEILVIIVGRKRSEEDNNKQEWLTSMYHSGIFSAEQVVDLLQTVSRVIAWQARLTDGHKNGHKNGHRE